MAVATITSMDAVLKELYPQEDIAKIWYKNSPLLALVKKRTDFYGKQQVVALRYAMPTGRSANFSKAQANQNPSTLAKFTVTRVRDYALAGIDGETIRAAQSDKGAIIETLDHEVGAAMDAMKRSIAVSMYRNLGGAIGQGNGSGSALGGTTITLLSSSDIVNFEKGQVITLASTDGTSGSVRAGNATITSVDRDNAILTCSAGFGNITGALDNDYIFIDGDFGAKMAGLASWVPPTVTSTAFYGLDRTQDTYRLGGLRWTTDSGGPIEQTLQRALSRAFREGAMTSHCFMNNLDFTNLIVSLGSRTIYDREESDLPTVGFKSLVIAGPAGDVKVIADPNCPVGTAYLLQLDTWTFWTLGQPGFLDEDGVGRILRDASSDSYVCRIGFYGNLICDAPGYNMRVTL
jgi:hypothetical protein